MLRPETVASSRAYFIRAVKCCSIREHERRKESGGWMTVAGEYSSVTSSLAVLQQPSYVAAEQV